MAHSERPVCVERLDVSALSVPTDFPESDGTAEWSSTTIVVVQAMAGGRTGMGWTYGTPASGTVIASTVRGLVVGHDAIRVRAAWERMAVAYRNLGRPGVASMAIAAVDTALWDLKARILGLPLATLLDVARGSVPVYGSGAFCSYPDGRLAEQLAGWVEQGVPRVKMKVGRETARDLERVAVAREAIGPDTELFVDANGALSRAQALGFARRYAEDYDVRWFEEPVSSDDLEGLRFLRDRAPSGMDIVAGEYGYMSDYFERMLAPVRSRPACRLTSRGVRDHRLFSAPGRCCVGTRGCRAPRAPSCARFGWCTRSSGWNILTKREH